MSASDSERSRTDGSPAGDGRAAAPRLPATWDGRLARLLILPLRGTAVTPNHVTTVALLTGLAAAALYATGDALLMDCAAAVYVAAVVLDHADGELARLTNQASAFGHAYDRAADLAVKLAVFTGMGLGLRHGPLGGWALVAGIAAGVAFVTIFLLRSEIARRRGDAALEQPAVAGFELEDILYVVAPVTWLGWLGPFVLLAGVGAPVFAVWVARSLSRTAAPAP